MKETIMAGASKIWALRMPGGPTRVVQASREISLEVAKKKYAASFAFKQAECMLKPDKDWPLQKAIDETEFNRDFSQFAEINSRTGNYKNLVEV
tara:strand:+ start:218 stop:499 length:282 start_codon:yes stop_codon:yes gene_type:complete